VARDISQGRIRIFAHELSGDGAALFAVDRPFSAVATDASV